MNPVLLTCLFFLLAAAGMVAGGVYVLAGPGWALIAGGIASFGFATILRRGLNGAG